MDQNDDIRPFQKYLIESGERDRLIRILQRKLNASDWHDKVMMCCTELLMEVGVDNITVDQLMEKITPKAREMVPNQIKQEMLEIIQDSLETKFNVR